MVGFIVFLIIAAFTGWYFLFSYRKQAHVSVPRGYVAWDGEQVYHAGEHQIPYEYQLVDIEERITTFGVDVLGTVSIVDTDFDETVSSHEDGYTDKGSFSKSGSSSKVGSNVVRTRQRENIRHRYIFVWKPNLEKLGTFLKRQPIPEAIAGLLRTVPEVDLEKYADYLGITFVSVEGLKPGAATAGVAIGDGVEIPYESRLTHMYVLGKSGMGKSTLLANIIRQDIAAGKGVAVIDPHGDLIDRVVPYIPKHRVKDVVYFDPAKSPIGINAFAYSDEAEKGLVAEDLFILFRRLTGEGGVRMDAILKRAIQLLLGPQRVLDEHLDQVPAPGDGRAAHHPHDGVLDKAVPPGDDRVHVTLELLRRDSEETDLSRTNREARHRRHDLRRPRRFARLAVPGRGLPAGQAPSVEARAVLPLHR